MKKLFIITILTVLYCFAFSQEVVRDTFTGQSPNGIVLMSTEQIREIEKRYKSDTRNSEEFVNRLIRNEIFRNFQNVLDERDRRILQIRRDVTHLTVRGVIIDGDLYIMSDSLRNLIYLDLSKVVIVPDFRFQGVGVVREDSGYVLRYPSWFDGSSFIPHGVFSVHSEVGLGPKNLRRVILPETLRWIAEGAFENALIDSIVIPHGVKRIHQRAFINCVNLRYVSLPGTLKTISAGTFRGCVNLKYVSLPSTLEFIGTAAFKGSGLTYIKLPESLRTIGERAFADTPNLRKVSVFWRYPDYTFRWYQRFQRFQPVLPPCVARNAFGDTANLENIILEVPRGTKRRYLESEPWRHFQIVERERVSIFNRIRNR